MKLIAKYTAGSISYGLDVPDSDRDERSCFLNTEIENIIGLSRHEHQVNQTAEVDAVSFELRHFLRQLQKGTTVALEFLFNKEWLELSPEFQMIINNRDRLIDTKQLFKSIRGYSQHELLLANGKRTGALGSKRKSSIETYGYSKNNFVNLFRLGFASAYYFQHGIFPVKIKEYDQEFHHFLFELKTRPENFNKEELNQRAAECEKMLVWSYENRKVDTKFDVNLANNICLDLYLPILKEIS